MVLKFLGREAASQLDYRNTDSFNADGKNKLGPSRIFSVENEFLLLLCRLKVG